jgi:hypothetical protein
MKKRTVHLMNSAMIPQAGGYTAIKIDAESFALALKEAHRTNELKSWIGYPQNVEVIEQLTGLKVEINKNSIDKLRPGDVMLCMRLKYRISGRKGDRVDSNDFQYFAITYKE